MFTLTSENITHLIQQIFLLCVVCGFVGAVIWDFIKGVCIWGVVAVGEVIDRKGRIKRSRQRAASLRAFGERAVKVADRMEAREDARSPSAPAHG